MEGVFCRVISVSNLFADKRDYEATTGEPPRQRDLADIRSLEGLMGWNI